MIPNSYEVGQKLKSRWKISFSQKGSKTITANIINNSRKAANPDAVIADDIICSSMAAQEERNAF
jgi:hypothetical protein